MSKGTIDTAKGWMKETAGEFLGSDALRTEGKADRLVGKTKDAAEKVANESSQSTADEPTPQP